MQLLKVRLTGVNFIWLSLLITTSLFLLAKYSFGDTDFSWLMVSQLASLWGTNLLCISFILSGRFKWLDKLFGGLDKLYRLHHTVGGLAFVLLLHHPLLLALNVLPRFDLTLKYLWFSDLVPYNLGILALYSLMLLLGLTLLINLPYHLWVKTHEFMGVSLAFGAFHILTISSDVSRYLPLRLWVILLLALSFGSVIYKRFLYRLWGPKFNYQLDAIKTKGEVVDIHLKPIAKAMNYYPGQYVFASFESLGKELHPYSIASCEAEGAMRLGIKILGDYTLKVAKLAVGEKVTLYGPYGNFFESLLGKKDMVWIAGGIGITPFLGMIEMARKLTVKNIDLVYCAKTESELVFNNEIRSATAKLGWFSYFTYCSDKNGRISASKVLAITKGSKDSKFLLCGPTEMMESMAKQLSVLGVPKKNIIFEDFSFR